MPKLTLVRSGRMPGSWFSLAVTAALLVGGSLLPVLASDDPYLDLLDQEASKVERRSTDTLDDGSAPPGGSAIVRPTRNIPSRERFEALLRQEHVGTYSFYSKLPERSREEVFLDFSRGTSLEALRKKIVDRYLHP